jgi:hypothetical protein
MEAAAMATAIWALDLPCQWLVTAAMGDHKRPIIGAIRAYSMSCSQKLYRIVATVPAALLP